MDSHGNTTILLISNSKLLKNKFIESLSNETNNFSLMSKNALKSETESIKISCFVCDYSPDGTNKTRYMQVIDGTERTLINTLIGQTIENKFFKFFINAIVYLFDENETDTFSYVQSIHNELKSNYREFMQSQNCLLCNMKSAIRLNETSNTVLLQNTDKQQQIILDLVERFLSDSKNLQYTTQEYENTILGCKPIEDDLLVIQDSFNQLIMRMASLPSSNQSQRQSKAKSDLKNNLESSLAAKMKSLMENSQIVKISPNGTKKVNSKRIYIGDTKDNVRDGFGTYVFENKFFRYEGEWKNGKKHGIGKLIMKDGTFYEGEFKDGEICGKGYKYDKATNTELTGIFQDGQIQGKSKISKSGEFSYDGDMVENQRHGYGELNEFKTGIRYQGQFYKNKKHGPGVQVFADSSQYSGDWVLGLRQGHGEQTFSDGSFYSGQWRGDIMNGLGFYKHFSGYVYEGLFVNGMPVNIPNKLNVMSVDEYSSSENLLKVNEGKNFRFTVQSQLNDGKLFVEEGRHIQIRLGIKLEIDNTDTYADRVNTEFGFSILPLNLESANAENIPVPLAESFKDHESENDDEVVIPIISLPKKKNSLFSESNTSGSTAITKSSQDVGCMTLMNQNGEAKFEKMLLNKIQVPEKVKSKKDKNVPMSSFSVSVKERNRLISKDNTIQCVIIAEDASKNPIFGSRLKSAYMNVVVVLKPVDKMQGSNSKSGKKVYK